MNTNERKTLGWKDKLGMKLLVNWCCLLSAGSSVPLAVCILMPVAMGLSVTSAQTREISTARSSDPESSEQTTRPAQKQPIFSTRLVPQSEGTPLPPQDLSIADAWPRDFKQLIDNMITLFPKNTVDPAPDIGEIQRKMEIRLTERPLSGVERTYLSKRYEISGTRYADTTTWKVFRAFYSISKDYNSRGERSQTLSLEIGPKQSGFCLNPYDFAVYTGWKFSNFDTSPHANVRYWSPAYVWGMFAWSNTGRYGGPGYTILVNMIQDATGKTIGADCVYSISVSGRYPKGE